MEEDYNNNSLAENKVLILYTLNELKSDVTDSELLKIVLKMNNINYFYFRDILGDLVDSNLISTYTKEDTNFYKITSKGENSLELTIDILPGIMKLKADRVLKEELIKIVDEESISAEYIPENEKEYTVKCKIVENSKTIFEMRVFAGSNEQAKNIADNWKNNASQIYPQIISMLNKG